MNSKAETEQSALDTVKLATASLLLGAAVVAFYYYAEVSKLARVAGLLVVAAISIVIALQTDKGRQLSSFTREAQIEVRKVVWPTRQETIQTTFVVFIVVIVIAIFLWILDLILGGTVKMVMGQGS